MSVHSVVIFASGSNDKAQLDVSPTAPTNVTYTITPGGTASGTPDAADNRFITSPDLFTISGGQTAIVTARTANTAEPSSAVLRQSTNAPLGGSGGEQFSIYVPPEDRAIGKSFVIPVGTYGRNASLLLAQPSQGSGTANVIVQIGAQAATNFSIDPLTVVRVPIGAQNVHIDVTVTNLDDIRILCQVAVIAGGQVGMFIVLPN